MKAEVEALEREIVGRINSLPAQNAEALRGIRREFSKKLKQASPKLVLQVAMQLASRSQTQFRFMAYELILKHSAALKAIEEKMLVKLGTGMDSWAAVDTFACYVAGPVWREGQVSDKLIRDWAASSDRWWRRAALVSTVPLNNKARGGSGDSERTLAVCRLLVKDRDDMVIKALSWSLRELAKRQPDVVADFLDRHANDLAPRVVREVKNKLRTGLKNPK
ncbi:MAG TPA: DNA alkylation repair protein [Pyrinomonadaceae bacterium]|nr:DNA alkylation repair protein [Pyrinomonadaceae bacterium]